jgi:amino acid transporter
LLLFVTLLLHQKYIPLDTGWGYWLSALLIVMSVSFFVSAAVSALKPGLFSKSKQRGATLEAHQDTPGSLKGASVHDELPLPLPRLTDTNEQEKIMARVSPPGSVTEGTTTKLDK